MSPYDGHRKVERVYRRWRWSDRLDSVVIVFCGIGLAIGFEIFFLFGRGLIDPSRSIWLVPLTLFAGCFVTVPLQRFLYDRSRRIYRSYLRQETEMQAIHPDYLRENRLLRAAELPAADVLLRAASGGSAASAEQLMRVVPPDETD